MSNKRYDILFKLKNIQDLPTLPVVMTRLSEAVNDTNCSINVIVDILNSDPAIASKVLKTVNSTLFSPVGVSVSNLQEAIVRLGFTEIKNIALSTAVFDMFSRESMRLFNRKEFWKHSIFTSLVAVELCDYVSGCKVKRDELHIASLLHGIGKIIMDTYITDYFETALKFAIDANMPLIEAEGMVLGITHCELGAMVAINWNLPETAINAISFYDNPSSCPVDQQPVIRLVNLAEYIVSTQDFGVNSLGLKVKADKESWDSLGLSADDVFSVVNEVKRKSDIVSMMLD